MKKLFRFTLILFFIILLTVPFSWVFSGGSKSQDSVVEARELVALGPSTAPNLQRGITLIKEGKLFEGFKIFLDLYINATFVEKFERATSDQFPFRMPIIQFSKTLDRELINFTYSFTNDPVIPADMKNGIYYDKTNNQLLQPVTLFNANARAQIDERIENYEDLIRQNPEQKFYVFYHQTIHNSEYHPMAKYMPEADIGQGIEYFEENLPEGLTLKKYPLTSMDDHLDYYYRTDHHWNVYGMWHAYEEIYEMLKQDYPDISPMLTYEKIVDFPEIEFLGYMARLTFYPIKGDDFLVEVIDIPEHEMYFSGQKVEVNTRKIYFDGDYSTIPYANHFNEFYGNVTDLIEYNFDNDADRNLLIIGSSFRNALDPLLASHYNKTYCIDLRYYTDFDLSDFLSKHKVDDILIVGDNEVALENVEYWKINP